MNVEGCFPSQESGWLSLKWGGRNHPGFQREHLKRFRAVVLKIFVAFLINYIVILYRSTCPCRIQRAKWRNDLEISVSPVGFLVPGVGVSLSCEKVERNGAGEGKFGLCAPSQPFFGQAYLLTRAGPLRPVRFNVRVGGNKSGRDKTTQ